MHPATVSYPKFMPIQGTEPCPADVMPDWRRTAQGVCMTPCDGGPCRCGRCRLPSSLQRVVVSPCGAGDSTTPRRARDPTPQGEHRHTEGVGLPHCPVCRVLLHPSLPHAARSAVGCSKRLVLLHGIHGISLIVMGPGCFRPCAPTAVPVRPLPPRRPRDALHLRAGHAGAAGAPLGAPRGQKRGGGGGEQRVRYRVPV